MARYRIVFKNSVAKDLRRIPEGDVTRILRRIDTLADEPRPAVAEKLSERERYRVRQDVYRILYEIADNELIVIVVKVGHRQEVYRRV